MSTSPESRAATRVAALPMTLNVTSVRLCSGLSHQSGLFFSIVRRSGSRNVRMNGPVPLALRVAKFSVALVRSAGWVLLCASHQALDMITHWVISSRKIGSGSLVTKSTV